MLLTVCFGRYLGCCVGLAGFGYTARCWRGMGLSDSLSECAQPQQFPCYLSINCTFTISMCLWSVVYFQLCSIISVPHCKLQSVLYADGIGSLSLTVASLSCLRSPSGSSDLTSRANTWNLLIPPWRFLWERLSLCLILSIL